MCIWVWNVYQILCVLRDNNNVSRFYYMWMIFFYKVSLLWVSASKFKKSVEFLHIRGKKDTEKTHDYHNLDHHLRTIIAHLWNYSRLNDFECYIYLNFPKVVLLFLVWCDANIDPKNMNYFIQKLMRFTHF